MDTTYIRTRADGDITIRTAAGNIMDVAPAALDAAEAVGSDLDADITRALGMIRAQSVTDLDEVTGTLAAEWDAADGDASECWLQYASAVVQAAASPDVQAS